MAIGREGPKSLKFFRQWWQRPKSYVVLEQTLLPGEHADSPECTEIIHNEMSNLHIFKPGKGQTQGVLSFYHVWKAWETDLPHQPKCALMI